MCLKKHRFLKDNAHRETIQVSHMFILCMSRCRPPRGKTDKSVCVYIYICLYILCISIIYYHHIIFYSCFIHIIFIVYSCSIHRCYILFILFISYSYCIRILFIFHSICMYLYVIQIIFYHTTLYL